jgi:branched-chain amino acid transport system substrate-binding protein
LIAAGSLVAGPSLAPAQWFSATEASASGVPAATSVTGAPFLLGVALPLTGDQALYGTTCKDAIEIATTYVNSHGGLLGHPLKLDFWDTQALPATGVAGTEYFISHHVNAVVGYFDSTVTIPSVRLLEAAGIPLFGDNPSTPALATMHLKNFVRVTSDDKDEGFVQANFAWQRHFKTAVTIDDDEIFGDAFATPFDSTYTQLGGKVLKQYVTQVSTTDFGSILAQIKTLHPQLIEHSGFNPAAALLVKQARAQGIDTPYITDSSQVGTDFTTVAGSASVGVYMTDLGGGTNNAIYTSLAKQMQSEYHTSLTPILANEYDAVIAVQQAAQKAGSIEPARLISVMHGISFLGATGTVSFLPDGDRAQVKFVVVQVTPSLTYKTVFRYATTLQ